MPEPFQVCSPLGDGEMSLSSPTANAQSTGKKKKPVLTSFNQQKGEV